MGVRGRPSAAALAVVPATDEDGKLERIGRPRPPDDMSDEQAEVWQDVVDSMPADWFNRANTPLLQQYCRHVIHARRLEELVERFSADPKVKPDNLYRLMKTQANESNILATLATKMRLAQQSAKNHSGIDRDRAQSRPRKPWTIETRARRSSD